MINTVNNTIMLLSKGMANRRLYFSDHPRVNSYATDIVEHLNKYFKKTGNDELFIGVVDGFFVFEGKRIFGPSVTGKQLIQLTETLHCGGFSFERGIIVGEIKKFFDITALRNVPVKSVSEGKNLFKNYGITNIRIAETFSDQPENSQSRSNKIWEGQAISEDIQSPTYLYQELYDVVSGAFGDAAFDRSVDVGRAKSVSEFMLSFIQNSFADVMQYVQYPDYDTYTVGHSVRVASLAVYVGSKMGWSEKNLLAIGTAGLLHDIGKCKIPDSILLKNGKLTDDEFDAIHSHPKYGVEILLEQEGISALDIAACWGHHLRYDGGGYPEQPAWAVNHPVTALLKICDVFEALTAIRPYKPAMEPQGAYTIMLKDTGGFHPGLLASFISIVSLYPPGTYVRLSDKRVGMVMETTREIDRPVLVISSSIGGAQLSEQDQYLLDLSDKKHEKVQITKLLLNYLT